jgi:hypothetical protein
MERVLGLALSNYMVIPHALRAEPLKNEAAASVTVDLANLFHHYYLDSFGTAPPQPDPVQFEHVRFLLPCSEFRFQGQGLGISPAIKRSRSTELGQAFCRWFLHNCLNITYFAHMEHVLDRQLHRAFEGCKIVRSAAGDAPDYFCAENVNRVYLAEAKGRYSAISFTSQEFTAWRKQFERVQFLDHTGLPRSIKGHIVATRFATERNSNRVRSGIWAEDPNSPGEGPASEPGLGELGRAVISLHYGEIARKLSQPVLAAALTTGVPLPEELTVLGVAWRVLAGPLAGRRFIGGYFSEDDRVPVPRENNGRVFFVRPDRLRLDRPSHAFFGVEEDIFKQVVRFARSQSQLIQEISLFDEISSFYSGFSVLRDGSAMGPLDWFSPEEEITL